MMNSLHAGFVIAFLFLVTVGSLHAQDEQTTEESHHAYVMRKASEYEVFVDTDDPDKLDLLEPVLRFNDNTTDAIDAFFLVWTDHGRPHACATFYFTKNGGECHEFQSLSDRPLVANRNGQRIWYPSTPGIDPQVWNGAPHAARSPSLRLAQMRAMGRRLRAAVSDHTGRIELRLMPQPLYRYGRESNPILDGAIFAFAKGTNPEILLLLEARKRESNEDEYRWHYSIVRMSSRRGEVTRRGEAIWTVPLRPWNVQPPDKTYFNVYGRFEWRTKED